MNFIISNFFTIFFTLVILLIVFSRFRKRKRSHDDESTVLNLRAGKRPIATPVDGLSRSNGKNSGDTHYQGITGGIEWTLTSSIRALRSSKRGGWQRVTKWRTTSVKMPAGKFILLMSMPAEIKTGQIKRGGFMNSLINKAADAVLDLYVTGYFGQEYCALVSIGEDAVKLERSGLNDFMILTNHEALAQSYFDEATTKAISHWKQSNQGFSQESAIDQFGLLFSPDGTILSCQTNMANEEEVKKFSDFGAVLAAKMKNIQV